jgi:predicted neuraminidase
MPAIFHAQLIYNKIKEPRFPFAHCSNLTQLNSTTLMAQWYTGKGEQARNQSIYGAKYDIKENKWSKPYLLSKTTEYPEGNGVIWKDRETNTLFLFYATISTHSIIKKSFGRGWYHCKLFYKTSQNDGETWNPIQTMKDEIGFLYRNKPLLLKNKRILVPMYSERPAKGYMAISDDRGKTFRDSFFIEDDLIQYPRRKGLFLISGNSQPTIVELDNGTIIALLRTQLHRRIFRSISEDHGDTWSNAQAIDLPNPDAGIDMIKTKSGKLVLVFNNAESGRHNLSIAVASDELGLKWDVKKVLDDGSKLNVSYPAIIQTDDSLIHVTYTYNRVTIKHVYFNEEWLLN